jgi:hypothetical protein
MEILIWILILSIAVMVIMITYRGVEISTGRKILSDSSREKADDITTKFLRKLWVFAKKIKNELDSFIRSVPEHLNVWLHKIWKKISVKIDKYFDRLKGRHGTGKRGIISLYWHESDTDR